MSAHRDYLDPTLRDDMRDAGSIVWCGECGEQVDAASECESLGVDADDPRCKFCCRCTDCAADLYSALHDPSTRNDAP